MDTFYSIIPHERLNWDIGWKKNVTYKCRAFKSVAIKFAPSFLSLEMRVHTVKHLGDERVSFCALKAQKNTL